jgi:hypothetical protein
VTAGTGKAAGLGLEDERVAGAAAAGGAAAAEKAARSSRRRGRKKAGRGGLARTG